jgi:hypothetical protein
MSFLKNTVTKAASETGLFKNDILVIAGGIRVRGEVR